MTVAPAIEEVVVQPATAAAAPSRPSREKPSERPPRRSSVHRREPPPCSYRGCELPAHRAIWLGVSYLGYCPRHLALVAAMIDGGTA